MKIKFNIQISCLCMHFAYAIGMLYDRSYMRETPRGGSRYNPIVVLIVANLSLFILQNLPKVFGGTFPIEWVAVTEDSIFGFKIWTLLTYCFFHDTGNLFHIFFNMLMLFFVGNGVVQLLGDRPFYKLYFLGALVGGLSWFVLQFIILGYGGMMFSPVLVGASAACYALIIFICVVRANDRVMLLFPPIEVKPKWLGWFLFGFQIFLFLTNELPGSGGNVAYSAHLGGMLVGFLWGRSYMGQGIGMKSFMGQGGVSIETPKWMKNKGKVAQKFSVNLSMDRGKMQKEVDRILDKINAQGFGSLSDDEKNTLDRAKDILGK